LLGAFYLLSLDWLLPADWRLLASGAGVLIILMVLPGGFGSVLYAVRDAGLRWITGRRAREPEPAAPETNAPSATALAGKT
jgi:hypothetical protein